jgi:hypothetical protein
MDSLAPSGTQRPVGLCHCGRPLDVNLLTNMAPLLKTPMVKWLSCLPSKQAARVRFPFGVLFFLTGTDNSATRSCAPFNLVFLCVHHCLSHCPFRHL